jgi:plastocyanin
MPNDHGNKVTGRASKEHTLENWGRSGAFSVLFMKLLCTLILSLTVICVSVTQAAVVGVEMRDPYYFTPTNVVINPGDRVVWTNIGIRAHDSRHMTNPALWASPNVGVNPPSNTFGFTFTNVGYYPYRCQQHLLLGPQQTGTVTVVNISLANALLTPTNAQFEIRGGRSGLKAIVEAGDTLGSATAIGTNTFPASGTINFADPNPPPTRRFYRSRVIP